MDICEIPKEGGKRCENTRRPRAEHMSINAEHTQNCLREKVSCTTHSPHTCVVPIYYQLEKTDYLCWETKFVSSVHRRSVPKNQWSLLKSTRLIKTKKKFRSSQWYFFLYNEIFFHSDFILHEILTIFILTSDRQFHFPFEGCKRRAEILLIVKKVKGLYYPSIILFVGVSFVKFESFSKEKMHSHECIKALTYPNYPILPLVEYLFMASNRRTITYEFRNAPGLPSEYKLPLKFHFHAL